MWIAMSVFIQLIRFNMCKFARTRLGDVSYCTVIFSRDKYFWCIFKLRAPPLSSPPSLFSLHPFPHSYFYSFRLGRASSFARPWPAFFVLASEIFQSQIEIMIFGVNPETTNKTTDYFCLFLFHPLLFVQLLPSLSRLSPAATLPISIVFALLLSSFWSFESPLSSISHHPPCRCVAAAMFWVRNSRRKTRWPSLTHICPTDLASDADGLLLCAVKSR